MSAELPLIALVVSVTVLIGCTLTMSRALPVLQHDRWWARRRTRAVASPGRQADESRVRRAVTGHRVELPTHPMPVVVNRLVRQPARQMAPWPDTPSETSLAAAERTIESLLETDPAVLAGIIMHWLADDHPTPAPSGDRALHDPTGRADRGGIR